MSVSALPAPLANTAAQGPAWRPAGRLDGLDGLRGIAALCLLWFHATGVLHPDRVNAVIRWLGLISFPLYAVNLPIMIWANGLGLGAPLGVAAALALASYLALRPSGAPLARAAAA